MEERKMALKMRFLYYSGKAKIKNMAELVKVEFVRRLRGEQVFDNINALRFQIEVDVARVKRGI